MLSWLKQIFQSSPPTAPPLSSLEFSDLIFHEKLGEGGYGVVHRVTFKTPRPDLTQAATKQLSEGDLKEEVNILKTLDHPNIVKLYGCLEGPASMYFILLEYASKGTVRDYLKRNQGLPISIQMLKKWTRESALALQYLHSKRVLHRDVKASNCLLFEDDLLKLSDFGLSREMEASQTTSTAKGTWRYMAPEIHSEHHFSFKSDIYAYGLLVLEIGTGKVPFEGLESFHVMYRVGSENLKPTIPSDFPETLADFIWRCWSPIPQYRPPLTDALEVIDGLPDDSDTSQGESASASPAGHIVKQWGLVTEFGKKGDAEGEFQKNHTLAVYPNGDVAVVDIPDWNGIPDNKRPPRRVFIFTSTGKFKLTLKPLEGNPEARLVSPHDVAITSHNQIAVIGVECKYVKLFNETGAYLYSFSVLSDNDDPNTQVKPFSISVAYNGDILVGCIARKVITIHESHDGRLTNTVNLSIKPHYITTNSKQQIIVCDWMVKSVQILSYVGDVIVSFNSFSVDGKPGMPSGLTFDGDNHLYIAVKMLQPATDKAYFGTGHIHQYSPWGRFLRCIITGMHFPLGITWHKNSIYVANRKSVLVYSQK